MDFIFIEEMRVEAHVGIYPRERAAAQTLELSLTFGVPDEAARDDDIAKTIDYAAVIARIRAEMAARQFNLLVTNVPGAQSQMYVAGTKLLETYAVPPLLHNQTLAIGVTSYNGMLYFGINADRDAMSDVDVLPSLLRESLDELLEAAQ